jgi:hypothetical protein
MGASTSSQVDVDDSPMTSTAKMGRRVRATRSDMWKDMDEVKKSSEVRVVATCNYCKSPTPSTGHLHWHIVSCKEECS